LPLNAERNLVERASAGEQKAMGDLYDAYLTRVYRFCLARVSSEADAEDLAEEIFLKVIGAIDGFEWRPIGKPEDGRSPFAAWLFRIARNHVVSFHRKAATRGPSSELSDSIRDERRGPQELTETKITIEEVFETVRELPEAQREVILLRFAAGLTVAETAEALGKQQTNVKVLQHKGVQKLKKLLVGSPELTEPKLVDELVRRTTTT
jgi:RNA polymerase sigma-70 factor (ECF subfamily)